MSKQPQRTLKTLDRLISKAGLGSRSEARSWIGAGRVKVNGKIVRTPDHWADPQRDEVRVDDQPLPKADHRYILLYKPKGYLTTYRDPQNRPTVYQLIEGVEQFVGTVGRLDLDTSGLLLLTNDHQLAEHLTNPDHRVPKTYLVKAATLLTREQREQLAGGVQLDDGPTRSAEVKHVRDSAHYTFLELTITEGRNRQVRRMLEAIGSKVLKLVRIRLGPLTLEGLRIGGWRDLEPHEIAALRRGMAKHTR